MENSSASLLLLVKSYTSNVISREEYLESRSELLKKLEATGKIEDNDEVDHFSFNSSDRAEVEPEDDTVPLLPKAQQVKETEETQRIKEAEKTQPSQNPSNHTPIILVAATIVAIFIFILAVL